MQIDSCSFLFPESEANSLRPVSGETHTRGQFLQAAAAVGATAAAGGTLHASAPAPRWPKLKGSPVLDSLHPVIERSRDVHTHIDKIAEVAGWMAYEELPMPEYQIPFGVGQGSADDVLDFILTANSVDTAFTDFSTHVKFQVDYAGRHWSDSDALFACMKRAIDDGFPILDGSFLARLLARSSNTFSPATLKCRCSTRNCRSGGRSDRCWLKSMMAAFIIS
jgi:hypothetical protein